MTDLDATFSEFCRANPVPDPAALDATRPPLAEIVDLEDAPAAHSLLTPGARIRGGPSRRPRRPMLAMAALVLVILGVVGLTRLLDPDDPDTVATLGAEEVVRRDALDLAQRWLDASNTGDMETMMAVSYEPTLADQQIFGWLIGLADAGLPTRVEGCEVTAANPVTATVDCRVVLENPVAAELGVDELIAPFNYREGRVDWLEYRGGDISLHNKAVADYLAAYEPERYLQDCRPDAYEPGSVISNAGLALTRRCAELVGPLASEVAQWIRDGRPPPAGG